MEHFETEEGHVFTQEEYIQYILWKTNELFEKGWSHSKIKSWEDDETWKRHVDFWFKLNNKKNDK